MTEKDMAKMTIIFFSTIIYEHNETRLFVCKRETDEQNWTINKKKTLDKMYMYSRNFLQSFIKYVTYKLISNL